MSKLEKARALPGGQRKVLPPDPEELTMAMDYAQGNLSGPQITGVLNEENVTIWAYKTIFAAAKHGMVKQI